jgi:hypothetical protein
VVCELCRASLQKAKFKSISKSIFILNYLVILIYIQQDATLHSLFYLETALHVLGGTTTHRQFHKQLYLQHLLFFTPLLLSAAIVEELELVLSVLWVAYGTHSTLKPVPNLPRQRQIAVTV